MRRLVKRSYGELCREAEDRWVFRTAESKSDHIYYTVGRGISYLQALEKLSKEKWFLDSVVRDEEKYILSKRQLAIFK